MFICFCFTVVAALACSRGGDLYFSIHFEQPRGIAEGDTVFLEGVAVGRIVQIRGAPSGIMADVKIFEEFKDRLRAGSTFSIQRPLPGLGARPRIEIEIKDPSSNPIHSGFEVEGSAATDTTTQ
ncbi:MlaD family protein [Acidobacteriota bacterium]